MATFWPPLSVVLTATEHYTVKTNMHILTHTDLFTYCSCLKKIMRFVHNNNNVQKLTSILHILSPLSLGLFHFTRISISWVVSLYTNFYHLSFPSHLLIFCVFCELFWGVPVTIHLFLIGWKLILLQSNGTCENMVVFILKICIMYLIPM